MGPKTDNAQAERLKIVAVIVAALVIVAIALALLVPGGGSGAASCGSPFQQSQDNCLLGLAESTHNSSMCGLVQGYQSGNCYAAVAEETNNATLCNNSGSQNVLNECVMFIANETQDTRACTYLAGPAQYGCIYQIAVDQNSTADCEEIANSSQMAACLSTVYFNNAVRSKNADYCAEITDNNDTNATLEVMYRSGVVSYTNLYANLTDMIERGGALGNSSVLGSRDLCYASLAYQDSDSAYCSSISNPNVSASCSSVISGRKVNLNFTMNYTTLENECISESTSQICNYTITYLKAVETKNVTLCKTIAPPYSNQCYYALASELRQSGYCSFISNSTENSDCILSVEGVTPNDSIPT